MPVSEKKPRRVGAKASGPKPDRWSNAFPTMQQQHDIKRQALVREAARAFGRQGFHNTSLDDIAKALGVTKPALYRYIKTKHDILYEAKQISLDAGIRAREEARAKSGKALEQLEFYFIRYIELLTNELGSYAVLSEPVTSLPSEYAKPLLARMREADLALRQLVEDAVAEGDLKKIDSKLAVAFFMGAITHISRWYVPGGSLSGSEIGRAFADFILNGLRGDRATSAR